MKSLHEHGRAKARERYGSPSGSISDTEEQKPQAPIDQHGPGYDNDVPLNSWLRDNAEDKPGFDKHKAGR